MIALARSRNRGRCAALCCALLAVWITQCRPQDSLSVQPPEPSDSTLQIENILLVGNAHTKDFVILREMTIKPGASINRAMIEYDKNRIYSLGLFNRVELHAVPTTAGRADLVVAVNERWYIFPFPVFGLKDRDWNKAYYGIGLLHNNFRGRNEKLYGLLVFGYDPSVALAYRNPFLQEDGGEFLEARAGYSKVRNKSIAAVSGSDNFDERHYSGSLTIGRRFGIDHTVWLSGGYESVEVSTYQPGRTIAPGGRDGYPVLGAGYAYDTRDLYEYPGEGTYARGTITKFGVPSADLDFVRYAADVRRYVPLVSNLVAAGRMFTDLVAAGRTPSYNRVYFGYGERIRGHFREVLEGENMFGASAALHYMLLEPRYFSVDFLPAQFGLWKFAVAVEAFGDAGAVWFRHEPFALDAFVKGYGIGIDFLLPYSAVLRWEYAWNEARRGEFIIDLGTAF